MHQSNGVDTSLTSRVQYANPTHPYICFASLWQYFVLSVDIQACLKSFWGKPHTRLHKRVQAVLVLPAYRPARGSSVKCRRPRLEDLVKSRCPRLEDLVKSQRPQPVELVKCRLQPLGNSLKFPLEVRQKGSDKVSARYLGVSESRLPVCIRRYDIASTAAASRKDFINVASLLSNFRNHPRRG